MLARFRSTSPDPAWFVRSDGEDGSRHIHGVGHASRVTIHAVELAGGPKSVPSSY